MNEYEIREKALNAAIQINPVWSRRGPGADAVLSDAKKIEAFLRNDQAPKTRAKKSK